jgi:hypothetical protein
MRLLEAGLVLGSVVLSGCASRLQSEPQAAKWAYGFWFWQGSSADAAVSKEPVDVHFVHAGTMKHIGHTCHRAVAIAKSHTS